MPYNADVNREDIAKLIERHGREIFDKVNGAHWRAYQEWIAFKGADDDAAVAARLGSDVQFVQDANTAMNGFNALKNFLDTNADPLRNFT